MRLKTSSVCVWWLPSSGNQKRNCKTKYATRNALVYHGNEEKIMHGENTYPEVIQHCSLGSPVVSVRSKTVVVLISGELLATIPRQCHHTQVLETNQVT
jgi:hypothetical protein